MSDRLLIGTCNDCGDFCQSEFCGECERTAEYSPPLSLINASIPDTGNEPGEAA